jgi:multiple sugar transport system permease protein
VRTTSPAPAEASGASVLGRPAAGAFVAPALLLVAGFLVFPALWTLYLGLTDYRLTGAAAADPSFVGWTTTPRPSRTRSSATRWW